MGGGPESFGSTARALTPGGEGDARLEAREAGYTWGLPKFFRSRLWNFTEEKRKCSLTDLITGPRWAEKKKAPEVLVPRGLSFVIPSSRAEDEKPYLPKITRAWYWVTAA